MNAENLHELIRMINSEFVKHTFCEHCGSSDARAIFTDGHSFCFACKRMIKADDESEQESVATTKRAKPLLPTSYGPLKSRGISEETCKKFRYGYGTDKDGNRVHLANYADSRGELVAQKMRRKGKKFSFIGNSKASVLFGQQAWAGGGRRIVVTEGEIDALSVAEVMRGWPVVSIQHGATGAKKDLKQQIEYLESFEEIVICFDSDDPGQKAALECAELFTPGKCKIAALPLKDASEMLMAGRGEELRKTILFNSRVFRPDGIINGDDPSIREFCLNFQTSSDAHYPWTQFDKALYGIRLGELVTLTSGTGMGKSTISREIAYHLAVSLNQRVGLVALEESKGRQGLAMMSIAANKRLHLEQTDMSQEEKEALFKASIANGNFVLYDHWGSMEADNLLSKIRYMIKGCGCRWIVLDHLSIVVSGLAGDDERKNLDQLMTRLRALVEETNCGMFVISHLSRKHDGKSHEEGAPISLRDLRGSHSIVQLSDIVLGFERNQQDEEGKNRIRVRKLKDRYSGQTGVVGELEYDEDTGRVVEPCDFSTETQRVNNKGETCNDF